MEKDYYSDSPSASAPTDNGAEASAGEPTAVLPKTFFPGGNPELGKECTVRIARVHDDQVEVEYVNSDEEAPPEEEEIVETTGPEGAVVDNLMG